MSALFSIISVPLGWLMRSIYGFVGNYGVTLILFTLLTKILLLPLTIKQKKSMIRMSAFQPEIQAIQKRYANDPQKQQEELTRLQQEHGFSMTSGCLPMLIQMPILFGLIDVIYKPLRYIINVPNATINTLTETAEGILGSLSRYSPQSSIIAAVKQAPDAFKGLLDAGVIQSIQNFNLEFLGLDLTGTPSLKVFNLLLLVPILSAGLMWLQIVLSQKLNGQKMEGAARMTPLFSVAMFLYFSFIMPVGVSLYWIFSSFFGIVQEVALRPFFDPEKEKQKIAEEIAAARKARKEKAKNRPAKVAKSEKRRDKYEGDEMSDDVKNRLARARALDKERYGE